MFFDVKPLPGDPILALMTAYREDSSENKVDLGVGVYQDDHGSTPVLAAVSRAEALILERQTTKAYVGIAGSEVFNAAMTTMLFGESHEVINSKRVVTVQSAGGSGGLRVVGELINSLRPNARIWTTTPTWPNHRPLLSAAGAKLSEIRYYDPIENGIDREAMFTDIESIPDGDVLLLHGCCHNPTGADLTIADWTKLAEICVRKKLLPFVDTAYQGFAEGIEEDAAGIRLLANTVSEMVAVTSCSKNFGLYRERTGAVSVVTSDATKAAATKSHLLKIVRSMISMPPDHGANIVATILTDESLSTVWREELSDMRSRMNGQRRNFVAALAKHGLAERFGFIAEQRGMFSLLGITREQIDHLQKAFHIYIVGSSRINVAGLTDAQQPYIAEALAETLASVG
ncbi:MAG: aromatic amino acid transaminase [Woeseiaceae bacterium]